MLNLIYAACASSLIRHVAFSLIAVICAHPAIAIERYLYVACPGIRNYLEFGGHGILVFDIDHDHQFLRRIAIDGRGSNGKPLNIKGICASAATARLYVSTLEHLICVDLRNDQTLWQRTYPGGCDRMSISPDGSWIYLPSLEKEHWKVVDATSGDELARVSPHSGAHNTIIGLDGREAYLAGLRSSLLVVSDTRDHRAVRSVGPFSNSIRPFTVNASQSLCFVNVNGLLGFEVGDLRTGDFLYRVEVQGVARGPVKRHGCPSHGIGLSPDEQELWVSDGHNSMLHVFDMSQTPPRQAASIRLRDQPGWVTFSLDGRIAYPSTGEVIDVATRRIVATLTDEAGSDVHSEKLLEVHFDGNEPIHNGDQFGLGRRVSNGDTR